MTTHSFPAIRRRYRGSKRLRLAISMLVLTASVLLGTQVLKRIDTKSLAQIPLQARLVAAVVNNDTGILEVDGTTRRIMSCTPEARNLLGQGEDLVGRPFESVFSPALWRRHGVSQGKHHDLGVLLVTGSTEKVMVMIFRDQENQVALGDMP